MRLIRCLSLSLLLVCPALWAQSVDKFPQRPVRIVVPFAAGGATDITARTVADKLSARWGQPVVVDNKPGAGGNLGSDLVAKAEPDGYTLVLGVTGSHAINTTLFKRMPYHPLKDFEPLTQATIYPNAIVVHPQVPANDLPELIALLKAKPAFLTRAVHPCWRICWVAPCLSASPVCRPCKRT